MKAKGKRKHAHLSVLVYGSGIYNLQLFYWHFLEILWLFIFLILYHFLREFYCIMPGSYKNIMETQSGTKCLLVSVLHFPYLVHQNFFLFSFYNLNLVWLLQVKWIHAQLFLSFWKLHIISCCGMLLLRYCAAVQKKMRKVPQN